ncbi:hypothetical protein AVEN_213744-1 [Araneus ventricosus]|uniref:Uncharacterized protein n=1 Tax=Araneus ventricosus TaxID=182803 RepID=A0A4Y2RRL3_ARAVE|nr:hypothetical protein AVEN_213744-1 [Araneus ventricosus]
MSTRSNLRKLLKRQARLLVVCPECPSSDPIPLDYFRKRHVKEVHRLTRTDCEFCFGAFRWKPGSLGLASTVRHQRACFETFRTEHTYVPPEPEAVEPPPSEKEVVEEKELIQVCDICKTSDASALKLSMFGREPVEAWKRSGFTILLLETLLGGWIPMPFRWMTRAG